MDLPSKRMALMRLNCGIGRRAWIAPGPGSGTLRTVALSAPSVHVPMYDTSAIVEGRSSYCRPALQVWLYSTLYSWSMMLPPTVPVAALVRMLLVGSDGTLASPGTSTCLVKKNGRLRANAVCTL